MTDIIVTMPKSRGGLKHLQVKIDHIQGMPDGEKGYAWWWVKQANELTTDSNVLIVCEGRLRGWFSIKWIVDVVYHRQKDGKVNVLFRNLHGKNRLETPSSTDDIIIKQSLERIDGSFVWIDPHDEFSYAEKEILSDVDEWHREGMQTIFFDEWFYDLEQPEMKGFQGFRYRR